MHHAIKKDVLEREVYLHLNAVGEVLQNLERSIQLRQAINKRDVFICGAITLDAVVVDELKVLIASLRFAVALHHILLKKVHFWQIRLHPSKKVKNDLLCFRAGESRSEKCTT